MLEILISSSVLIAVLALLRRFLRGRISARLQYALWALVLLRLLVPLNFFESKVSVSAAAEPVVRQVQEYSAQRVQTVYIPVDLGEHPETGEPMEAVGRTYVEPLDVARWVWYGGMAVTALFFAGVNLRMARRLKKDRVYYGSHRSVAVYIAQNIPSPCLFGLFRPAIYLTEQAAADETQAGQILAHEYSHLRHGDLFWAFMRSLCLVIWWFDPFVWWAAVLSRRDGELACDESAIRRLGEEQRFNYGRTLLALATVKLRPGDLLCGATTMTGGKNSLRERIEGIARTKKLSLSLAAVALVIVALAVGCTFSGAGSNAAPTSTPQVTPAPVPVPTDGSVILGEGYESYDVILDGSHHADAHHDVLGAIDPEQTAIQATLLDFIDPAFVMISRDDGYVSDGTAFADLSFEDLLFSTDSWQVDTAPRSDVSRSETYITLFDGKGSFVIIDAERDEISFHPQSQFYAAYSIPDTSGSFYYDSLLAWASELPQMGEDPEPAHSQFLTLALTTDYQGRYSRLSEAGPSAAAYEAFYADFKELCDPDFYYTMMLNREICSYDEMARERGYAITPLSFEITAVNHARVTSAAGATDRWQHEFTAHCQVTTDEGLTGSATLSGYILTDADSADAPVSGFQITGGTVLNADPADDVLGTEMQMATESGEITRITIPAGCSMGQIFQLLEDNGICDKEALYEAAANYDFSYDWLEELPLGDATRLEGYLFPDTYNFYPGESAANVIDRFLNRFHNILTPDMQKQADRLNISLHEAVIIASLIEKEAGVQDDRSLFSSVIHNRLDDGWKLQLDSTLYYIKGTSAFELTHDDIAINSPYNTYLYEGLPAGPICSPGNASLEAALNPSSTNYWYWYTFEGTTHFFSSDSEFNEFVAAHP